MKEYLSSIVFIATVVILAAVLAPFAVSAYQVETIDVTGAPYKDFVIGPGKIEVELKPGEQKRVDIKVTNRMGEDKRFKIEVEDFRGSKNPAETVVLLGDDRGPYSLRDFITVSEPIFDLKNGERATVPVIISLPADAEPGGLFGSVLFSVTSKVTAEGNVSASAVVSRIGTLIFVKVPGEVKQDGRLASFTTSNEKKIFASGPVEFRILYENNGSTHVNPYGEIKITNMLGETVGAVEVEPWFALPDSLRLREVSWDRSVLFGRYTATASINRGYGDIVDTASFSFWVIPWKIALAVVGGCIIVVFGLRFIFTRFEFKRKQ